MERTVEEEAALTTPATPSSPKVVVEVEAGPPPPPAPLQAAAPTPDPASTTAPSPLPPVAAKVMGRAQPERDDTLYDLLCLLYPDPVERAQAAVRLAVRTYTPEGGVVPQGGAAPPPISTTAALRTARARIAPKEEDQDGEFYAAYPTPAVDETDEDEAEEDENDPDDGSENIAKDSDEEASCEWVWLKDRGLRERAKEAEQERATSRKRRRHTIAATSTSSSSAGTSEEQASGSRKKRRRRSPGESRFLDGARVPLHGSGKDEGLPLVADEYERNKAKALLRDMRDSLGLPPVNNKVRMLHWSLEEGHEYERIMAEKKGEFIRWMDEQGLRPTTVRAKKRLWEYLGDYPQVALCRVGLRRWERGITIQLLREAIDADPDEKAFWSQPLTDQQRELIKLAGP